MSAGAPRQRQRNRGLRKRCDCPRSKWDRCEHPWHFNYHYKGEPYRVCLDTYLGRHVKGKRAAEEEAEELRRLIRKGQFGIPVPAPVRSVLTVVQLLEAYVRDYVTPERPRSIANATYQIAAITRTEVALLTGEHRPFGVWPVTDVTTGTLEKFRAARRTQTIITATDQDGETRARRVGGVFTTNRNLAFLRAAFNWGIRIGELETTPFKRHTETVIKLSKESARCRRLEPGELERLLQACDPVLLNPRTKQPRVIQPRPRMRPLVEAALESGCRIGELLSLQWYQVKGLEGVNPRLDIPAAKAKTQRARVVPISTRLKAILEMRRKDPAGDDLPPDAYVFGNELGQQTKSIDRAWQGTCQRANLNDLHFHDLRREAGSRWLEGGVPLHTVRDWLGHTNIAQTSTYLNSTLKGQHEVMQRFDERNARAVAQGGGTDDAGRVQTGANSSGTMGDVRTLSTERPN